MHKSIRYIAVFFVLGFMASCGDSEVMKTIDNPVNYDFQRNGESTVSYNGQTTRIEMATELISAMKDFDNTSEDMLAMFANQAGEGGDVNPFSNPDLNSSTKSIKSKVAASKDFFSTNTVEAAIIKSDFDGWIKAQVDEVYQNRNELATPGVAGQIADESAVRYVSGKGLEYNQAVNKGLIGALMVDQMLNNYLSISVLDVADNVTNNDAEITEEGKPYTTMEHKWDEGYGYLFGKSSVSSDPLSTLGEDEFLNKYLSRVDGDIDFTGIASDIFESLKLGRAAIVAGDYSVRDQEANKLRVLIGKVIAVRAVYYLQQGKILLPRAGSDYGAAFHSLSEGYGFVYSLRFLRQPNSDAPYFSKSEVDGFITKLTAGNGFWDLDGVTLDEMSVEIASKFDFTVAEAAQ